MAIEKIEIDKIERIPLLPEGMVDMILNLVERVKILEGKVDELEDWVRGVHSS